MDKNTTQIITKVLDVAATILDRWINSNSDEKKG